MIAGRLDGPVRWRPLLATGLILVAGPLIALLGLHGALIAAGLFVLGAATLLLRRPFRLAELDTPQPAAR
jgi:hypothetical protein